MPKEERLEDERELYTRTGRVGLGETQGAELVVKGLVIIGGVVSGGTCSMYKCSSFPFPACFRREEVECAVLCASDSAALEAASGLLFGASSRWPPDPAGLAAKELELNEAEKAEGGAVSYARRAARFDGFDARPAAAKSPMARCRLSRALRTSSSSDDVCSGESSSIASLAALLRRGSGSAVVIRARRAPRQRRLCNF